MRIGKKVTKTVTQVEEHENRCDLCKEVIKYRDDTDVEVRAAVGDNYPEGDCRDHYRVDMCSDCFLNRLLPMLKTWGVEPHTQNLGHYWDLVIDEDKKET